MGEVAKAAPAWEAGPPASFVTALILIKVKHALFLTLNMLSGVSTVIVDTVR